MKEIKAQVSFPVAVIVEVTDEELEKIRENDWDTLQVVRGRILDEAENILVSSGIDPIIFTCDEENMIWRNKQ